VPVSVAPDSGGSGTTPVSIAPGSGGSGTTSVSIAPNSGRLEQCQSQLHQTQGELECLRVERDWLESQVQAWIQTAQQAEGTVSGNSKLARISSPNLDADGTAGSGQVCFFAVPTAKNSGTTRTVGEVIAIWCKYFYGKEIIFCHNTTGERDYPGV
jgi:hypothetical protein